jgi:hypothetical protein
MTTRTDTLNDALDRLRSYAYVDGIGFACHGPMGAEALSALGHDDAVAHWVEAYKTRHAPIEPPPATQRIDPDDEASWRPALGDFSRVSDWAVLFDRELGEQPWQAVLNTWAPRLFAGYGGGLTHGLLRVAHAVRGLTTDRPPSGPALDELAKGLASWAGWFTTLPGRPQLAGSLSLEDAIARLPRPREPWTPIEAGMFTRLGELGDFPAAVEALGPPKDADEALSDLTAMFCRILLANPDVVQQGLVHAVTPVVAVRSLLPYLPELSTETVYAQLWQVDAAIACGFLLPTGPIPNGSTTPTEERDVPSPAEIAARAVEHRDPHVVKYTEACLREHSRRPDPAYLLAAQALFERTPAW